MSSRVEEWAGSHMCCHSRYPHVLWYVVLAETMSPEWYQILRLHWPQPFCASTVQLWYHAELTSRRAFTLQVWGGDIQKVHHMIISGHRTQSTCGSGMAVSTNSSLVDPVAVQSQRRLRQMRRQQFQHRRIALVLCCAVAAVVTASFIPHPCYVWTVPR